MQTPNESKPRASTDDALNALIIAPATSLADAMRKYEPAISPANQDKITGLGWQIIALDLTRFGSSDLMMTRAACCHGLARRTA